MEREDDVTGLVGATGWEAVHLLPHGDLLGYLRPWNGAWQTDDGELAPDRRAAIDRLKARAAVLCPFPLPPPR